MNLVENSLLNMAGEGEGRTDYKQPWPIYTIHLQNSGKLLSMQGAQPGAL